MRLPTKPVLRTFKLVVFGFEGEAEITVRQATTGDVRQRADLFSQQSFVLGSSMPELRQRWNLAELQRYDAYLTLAGCTIVDEDGNPWFEFKDTPSGPRPVDQNKFYRAWDALPPEISSAIYEFILEVNPMFSGRDEDEGE